jgi:hypothetical protein
MIHLVTGGARSGKSTFALQEVLRHAPAGPIGFIATAQALDDDMQQRIRAHQAERDARFLTFEAPIDLSGALAAPAPAAGQSPTVAPLNLQPQSGPAVEPAPPASDPKDVPASETSGRLLRIVPPVDSHTT